MNHDILTQIDLASELLCAANTIHKAYHGYYNTTISEAERELDDIDDDSTADDIEYHASEALNAIEAMKDHAYIITPDINTAYQTTLTAAENAIEELRDEAKYNGTDDETDNDND